MKTFLPVGRHCATRGVGLQNRHERFAIGYQPEMLSEYFRKRLCLF